MSGPALKQAQPRRGYFAELADGASYRHGLYFALAGPLGLLNVLALALIFSGVLTSPLLLGLPLLWLGGVLLRWLANLDRTLGSALLQVNLSRPASVRPAGLWPWLRGVLTSANTYKVLLYSVLKMPLALLSSAWLLATLGGGLLLVGVPIVLLCAPQWNLPLLAGQYGYQLTPLSEGLLILLGLLTLLLGISGLNLLARAWMVVSFGLLTDYGENAPAVREVAALRAGAATVAFAGSLEETLGKLLQQALAATTAQAARLVLAERTVAQGANFTFPEHLAADGRDTLRRVGDQQVLSFAVAPRGEVLGTLQVAYVHAPSTREMQFWAAVADQAASAADTARLIERAQTEGGQQERARLARELHDSVAQALYGVSLATRTARALIEKHPARASESLDFAVTLADGASAEMRALLFALRPDALEEGGLAAALTRLAEMLRLRYQLAVTVHLPAEPPLEMAVKGALYRVAQEATHNAVKHARARQVWLRLEHLPDPRDGWQLSVQDDGAGFDSHSLRPGSLGLKGMRERAALIGGELEILSATGEGTTVRLNVPAAPPETLNLTEKEAAS